MKSLCEGLYKFFVMDRYTVSRKRKSRKIMTALNQLAIM